VEWRDVRYRLLLRGVTVMATSAQAVLEPGGQAAPKAARRCPLQAGRLLEAGLFQAEVARRLGTSGECQPWHARWRQGGRAGRPAQELGDQ
jgi:hypothetical protein